MELKRRLNLNPEIREPALLLVQLPKGLQLFVGLMSVSSFFSSFFDTVHGDAPEEKQPENKHMEEEVAETAEPSGESEEAEEVEAEDVGLHTECFVSSC
jgi:hypothetical protein